MKADNGPKEYVMPESISVPMLQFICDKSTRNKISAVLIENTEKFNGLLYFNVQFVEFSANVED